jgi:hypothetical protein
MRYADNLGQPSDPKKEEAVKEKTTPEEVQWGNHDEQRTPMSHPYLDTSQTPTNNLHMRTYNNTMTINNTDETPVNVGTIESPDREFRHDLDDVNDFMLPEKDTNNHNIMDRYKKQVEIAKTAKGEMSDEKTFLLGDTKRGFPSMLDSGIQGINVPAIPFRDKDRPNSQSQVVSEAESPELMPAKDNNFDTMTNPDIKAKLNGKDQAAAQIEAKRAAKQEVLIIGFDQKPKGKHPLLNWNKRGSPERNFNKEENLSTSNLTGYEIGRTNGPTFNKSIKSEMSTKARRE